MTDVNSAETMDDNLDVYQRQLSADLEILSWYRALIVRLDVAETLAEPPEAIVVALLAGMRRAVAADCIVFVPYSCADECFKRSEVAPDAMLVVDGERRFDDEACFGLVEAFQHDEIKCDVGSGEYASEFANVRNVVVVQINKQGYSLGFLLAVNSRSDDGFGTQEVTLLRMAASILAYYGHNFQLTGRADDASEDGRGMQLPRFVTEAAG